VPERELEKRREEKSAGIWREAESAFGLFGKGRNQKRKQKREPTPIGFFEAKVY